MTDATAAAIWAIWLLGWVGGTFLVLEFGLIAWAHLAGQQNIYEWTLSDTVRRWSSKWRWVSLVLIGLSAALMWHLFGQANPPPITGAGNVIIQGPLYPGLTAGKGARTCGGGIAVGDGASGGC